MHLPREHLVEACCGAVHNQIVLRVVEDGVVDVVRTQVHLVLQQGMGIQGGESLQGVRWGSKQHSCVAASAAGELADQFVYCRMHQVVTARFRADVPVLFALEGPGFAGISRPSLAAC